jgi:hypothetical protein
VKPGGRSLLAIDPPVNEIVSKKDVDAVINWGIGVRRRGNAIRVKREDLGNNIYIPASCTVRTQRDWISANDKSALARGRCGVVECEASPVRSNVLNKWGVFQLDRAERLIPELPA